ncbi:hypothetical protein, partial [Streptomyces sp. NPDC005859]|uniref:hypothetical protein n=1 Tax=Streptomyces sp. NPDC005859 TaxID=3157170 RepID=UPI0033EBF103
LLMLDEPLGQLDRSLRERLVVELRELFGRLGRSGRTAPGSPSQLLADPRFQSPRPEVTAANDCAVCCVSMYSRTALTRSPEISYTFAYRLS